MTCHDCIHKYVCKYDRFFGVDEVENKCLYFKNKADFVKVKDCNLCIYNSRHATEYPCSYCKNCYTDKFKPYEERTDE